MKIPYTLEDRLRRGRVVPFVGAGVSMPVQDRDGQRIFPHWRGLLLAGARRLEAEGKAKHADLVRLLIDPGGDYLQAAERLRAALPGGLWTSFLNDNLSTKHRDVDIDSLALARAVWQVGSLIITTNYDRVLDWACPTEVREDLTVWDVEAPAEQARLLREDEPHGPTVWHLHGRIDNVDGLVLTPDGYERLYGSEDQKKRHQTALRTLRHLLTSRTFLFIGFSLTDKHSGVELRGVRDVFRGHSGPHYALVRPEDASRVRDLGVEPILFESFGEPLVALVEALGHRAAAEPETRPARDHDEDAGSVDWSRYLDAVIDQTDHINIRGITTSSSVRGARHPIERLYTPLSSRGPSLGKMDAMAEDDPASMAAHFEGRMALADLLPRHDRLLLEGQPGAGKTTFLRLVACMLARDAAGHPVDGGTSWRGRYLGLEGDAMPPTPVLIRLADLVPLLEDGPALRQDDRRRLLDVLDAFCTENEYRIPRSAWQTLFEKGSALLLLDGLDEVADPALRARLFDIFRDACKHWTNCPIVVASRPISTGDLVDMGFRVATIEPFSDREIGLFVDHWVTALHAAGHVEELGPTGEEYRQELMGAVIAQPRVRRLATNPVMLTCLCVVHWNEGRLPEGRSRVYAAVIRWLLAARTKQRQAVGFSDRFAHRALARLALAMMESGGGKRSTLSVEGAAVAVDPVVQRELPNLDGEERRYRAREWLRFECLGSGIIEEVTGQRVRFWHLTFQEYLAAQQLAWRGDGDGPEEDWWPRIQSRLDDAQWRETVELVPGCLFDEGGEDRVDRLLDRVLELSGDDPDLAADARIAGIVGRLLQPLGVFDYQPRPEIRDTYQEALRRSLEIFTPEGAAEVPVADRIAVAEALGRGGDPRLQELEKNLIEVPGCDGWRLGKYPVTVEEYQHFVEHRGYEEQKHWSTEGWASREKEDRHEPEGWAEQLTTPNRPVVGISWYEASAYCAWLSVQRNEEIRLPTEKLWAAAATPEKGEYPWGEAEPDDERANYAPGLKPNIGAPTPVGVYPAGCGRYGHLDLAGNVWEWSADGWKGPEDLDKVLRGCGWHDSAELLRAANRHRDPAAQRDDLLGFRLSAGAPAT